jgi:hypothetical protein
MAFCEKCGNQLKPQGKFCEACGTVVKEEKPVQPMGAAPAYVPPPYQPAGNAGVQRAFGGGSKLPVIILACALVVVLIGGVIGIATLSGTVSKLRTENTALVADNNRLASDLNTANNNILRLNNELVSANNEISDLTGDLNNANDTIDDLNSDLAAASSSLNAANATIANLDQEKQQLAADKSKLAADLEEAAGNILALNSIIDIMNANYSEIIDFIETRFGLGEEDATQFVTPDDDYVELLVSSLVGHIDYDNWNKAWQDIQYMYAWVRNNIEYNYDTPLPVLPLDLLKGGSIDWFREFWQYPAETIYLEHGDCEDQALLLASMINNYGAYAHCVGISNADSGHMAIFMFIKGGNLVILDPAGSYYTNTWGQIDTTRTVEQELNNWLNWWSPEMPGAEIDMLFDSDEFWTFDGNADFLNWYFS